MPNSAAKDGTAHLRMRRLRTNQEALGLKRVEVKVPTVAADAVRQHADALSARLAKAAASRSLSAALTTVNVPLPRQVLAGELVVAVLSPEPKREWRVWVASFLEDNPIELLHGIVLEGVFTFEELYRAARTWRLADVHSYPWIKEMADLGLARAAWLDAGGPRQPAGTA